MQIFSGTKKIVVIYTAIIFFVILDRFFKVLALANQAWSIDLIGEVLKFNYRANYYIAFSLPLSGPALEAVLILIILVLIYWVFSNWLKQSYNELAPLVLIILGAISNLLDRFKYGWVIDYLDLKYFTVFNLADAMIVTGVILLAVALNKKSSLASKFYNS